MSLAQWEGKGWDNFSPLVYLEAKARGDFANVREEESMNSTNDEKTGLDLEFEPYVIAHDLPAIPLITWTYHDKPSSDGSRVIRSTSVSILTGDGDLFTGVSGCSELDMFNKKDGFNRAYGRACAKLAAYLRGLGQPDATIKLSQKRHDIDRWVANHAFQAKLEFLKVVYSQRIALAQAKNRLVAVQQVEL